MPIATRTNQGEIGTVNSSVVLLTVSAIPVAVVRRFVKPFELSRAVPEWWSWRCARCDSRMVHKTQSPVDWSAVGDLRSLARGMEQRSLANPHGRVLSGNRALVCPHGAQPLACEA